MEIDNGKNDCNLLVSPVAANPVQSSPTVKYAHLLKTIQELQHDRGRSPEIAAECENGHRLLEILPMNGIPLQEVKYTQLMITIESMSQSGTSAGFASPLTNSNPAAPNKSPNLVFSSFSKLSTQVLIDRENSSATGSEHMETSKARDSEQIIPSLTWSEMTQSISRIPREIDQIPIIKIIPLHQLQDSSNIENSGKEGCFVDENSRLSLSGSSSGYGTDIEVERGLVQPEPNLRLPRMKIQFSLQPRRRLSQGKRRSTRRRQGNRRPVLTPLVTQYWPQIPVMNQIQMSSPEPWSSRASLNTGFESLSGQAELAQSATSCQIPPSGFISHREAETPASRNPKPKENVRYLEHVHLVPNSESSGPQASGSSHGEPLVEHQVPVRDPEPLKPRKVIRYFHQIARDDTRDLPTSCPSGNQSRGPLAENHLFVKLKDVVSVPKVPRPRKAVRYFNPPVLEDTNPNSHSSGPLSPGPSQVISKEVISSVYAIPNPRKVILESDHSSSEDVKVFALRSRENPCKRKRISSVKKATFRTYRTRTEVESESESDSDFELESPQRQKPKMELCDLKLYPEVRVYQPAKCFESPQVPEKLYYYTTEEDIFFIFQQKYIGLNEMSTARNGPGVYFSEILPENESWAIYYNNNYGGSSSSTTDFSRTEFCMEFSSKLLPALRFCVNQRWHFSDIHGWRASGIWKSAVSKLQLIFTQGVYYRRELDGPGVPKNIQSCTWDLG